MSSQVTRSYLYLDFESSNILYHAKCESPATMYSPHKTPLSIGMFSTQCHLSSNFKLMLSLSPTIFSGFMFIFSVLLLTKANDYEHGISRRFPWTAVLEYVSCGQIVLRFSTQKLPRIAQFGQRQMYQAQSMKSMGSFTRIFDHSQLSHHQECLFPGH